MLLMMHNIFFRKNMGEKNSEQFGNVVLGLMIMAVIAKYADKIFPSRENNKKNE